MKEGSSEFPDMETREEQIVFEASKRIGGALSETLIMFDSHPRRTQEPPKTERHFWFRPKSRPVTRIEVDAFDYAQSEADDSPAKGLVRRSFWIRLIPPESIPQRYWIISESGSPSSSPEYQAHFIHLSNRQGDAPEREDKIQRAFQNPTPQEMEEAAQLLEECLQDMKRGDSEAIIALGEGWQRTEQS